MLYPLLPLLQTGSDQKSRPDFFTEREKLVPEIFYLRYEIPGAETITEGTVPLPHTVRGQVSLIHIRKVEVSVLVSHSVGVNPH